MKVRKKVITQYELTLEAEPGEWPDVERHMRDLTYMLRPVMIELSLLVEDGKTHWAHPTVWGGNIKKNGEPGSLRTFTVHEKTDWNESMRASAEKALRDAGLWKSDPLFRPAWI